MTKVYAGIGARKTPETLLRSMTSIATQLCEQGWKLRSGHARGADQAFQRGAYGINTKEIHLPWDGYNYGRTENSSFIVPKPTEAIATVAAKYHPAWDRLSDEVKLFMLRNVTIVLGEHLDRSANMVICWTPEAAMVGGTAHAMRIALAYDIPVFNLASDLDREELVRFVQ